jgi:UDP-N-acetylglucosamine 2-epimerase
MRDALLRFLPVACARSSVLQKLQLEHKSYGLLTLHRAENVDDRERLGKLLKAVSQIDIPLIFLVHPRTRQHLGELPPHKFSHRLRLIDPVGYLDMLVLQSNARIILTDSGGVQREAHFLSVPSIILRKETEWPEVLEEGASRLAEEDLDAVAHELLQVPPQSPFDAAFGNGDASYKIVRQFDQLEGATIQSNPTLSLAWN